MAPGRSAGICVIKGLHLRGPCPPAAGGKVTGELHLQAGPPCWARSCRAQGVSFKYQMRLRPPFLAVWGDFFRSQPIPFGQHTPHRRACVTATLGRHPSEHFTRVVSLILSCLKILSPCLQRRELQLAQPVICQSCSLTQVFSPTMGCLPFSSV